MTTEEIVRQALARAAEFADHYPTTRKILYRQVGVRQQRLFRFAATVNPEWAGVCATADLADGEADLGDIADPVPSPATVTMVEVLDPGASGYDAGDRIHVVPLLDPDTALPPRATLRNRVLSGYLAELDAVTSIKIHYSRVPRALTHADADVVAEIPEPHDELLVLDLAQFLLRSSRDRSKLDAALELLAGEEDEALTDFAAFVAGYVVSDARFGDGSYGAGGA